MKLPYYRLILLLSFCCNLEFANAQAAPEDTTVYEVQTKDGNEFIGTKIMEDAENIILRTVKYGDLTIKKTNIKSITPIDNHQFKDDEYWFENPQATRYFWSPNGYGLKSGEGYYQNVWIFFNQVSFGITKNVSLGMGIIPTFLLGSRELPIWVTPKFSVPIVKDKVNIGGGALVGGILGFSDTGFGLLYGHSTFGNKDRNINFGVGWGFVGGEISNIPTFTLSSMFRINKNTYLLSENYFINTPIEGFTILSFGARSLINRVSLDYGLFVPVIYELDQFVGIPWLGLVVPFGNNLQAKSK